MSIKLVRCSVLGANVACVTNRVGETVRVVCSARDDSTGACRLKHRRSTGGPLSQLFERINGRAPTQVHLCHVRAR
jgi:hypothetical protein